MVGDLVGRTLKHAWLTLQPLNIPAAVMGGVAVSLWKHFRATRDVDLLIGIGEGELEQLLQRVTRAKMRPKGRSPVLTIGPVRIIQLLYEPPGAFMDLQVDLLIADTVYQKEALARRVPKRLPDLDLEFFVLTCEDMILHKLLANRVLDRADAAMLLRNNIDTLDRAYLLRWSGILAVGAELEEAWEEAFPGEPLPSLAAPDQP
jgi:hypothetical protein